MDDTISRQAAIDALGAEPEVWINDDDYAMGANNQWHYDVNALKAVLSAEPTYNDGDIQKMQDLEQAQLEKAYQLGYEEGKKDAQPEERTGKRTETHACDSIDRQAAIDIERNATVDTNPSHFEAHQKFTQFMDDAEISSFGRWQWSNGFNTALTAVGIDLKKLPSAEPEQRWILCSERLPDSNGYVLVTDFGETDIGRRYDGKWVDDYGEKMKDVVAWMPLPQPYQAERREG